jgi:hypothetical protein
MGTTDRRLAVAALCLALTAPACATEGGGSALQFGGDTNGPGIMPPPGFMVRARAVDYGADRRMDHAGNELQGVSNFDVHVTGSGTLVQRVWPGVELWGANVMTQAAVGYLEGRIRLDASTPNGVLHVQGEGRGWADMLVGPVSLGWHAGDFHQIAGINFVLPTGEYDLARTFNPGRNYLSTVINYAFTWLPTRDTEVSASTFYLLNRENPDTGYRSGRELAMDYGLGYGPASGWQVGAAGYLYKQVSDDKVRNGAVNVPDGNRGQVVAVGPFLRRYGRGWGFTLKWQREYAVENRVAGDRWMLQGGFIF